MQFFTATSILAALASSACSADADTEGLQIDATVLNHVNHKSIHSRTATVQDYPWFGVGAYKDANNNSFSSFYIPVLAPGLFDHECVEQCLQNSDGLICVQVYL